MEVLEHTSQHLSSSFTTMLLNAKHWRIMGDFLVLSIIEKRCPHLHPIFQTPTLKLDMKTSDVELVYTQALVINLWTHWCSCWRPLWLEVCQWQTCVMWSENHSTTSVTPLTYIAHLRKKVVQSVNPDIQDPTEEEEQGVSQTVPNLFGRGFEAKSRRRQSSSKFAKPKDLQLQRSFFRMATTFLHGELAANRVGEQKEATSHIRRGATANLPARSEPLTQFILCGLRPTLTKSTNKLSKYDTTFCQ